MAHIISVLQLLSASKNDGDLDPEHNNLALPTKYVVKKPTESTEKRHRHVHRLGTLACCARVKFLKTNPIVCGTMQFVDIKSLGGSCGHFCVSDILGTVEPELHYNAIYLNSKGIIWKKKYRRLDIFECKDLVKKLSSGRIFIQSCPKGFCKCTGTITDYHVPILYFQIEETSRKRPILLMAPSIVKVQEIYLNAAKNISGLCGMIVEMLFPCADNNHLFNLWPKLNQEGETVFEMRHLSSRSSSESLNYYFSGTDHNFSLLTANENTAGYYLFHFIVDTKEHLDSDSLFLFSL